MKTQPIESHIPASNASRVVLEPLSGCVIGLTGSLVEAWRVKTHAGAVRQTFGPDHQLGTQEGHAGQPILQLQES